MKKLAILLTMALAFAVCGAAMAEAPKTAPELGLMQGFPPPADKRVDKSNWLAPPFNRWAFQHMSIIHNVATVRRGEGAPSYLPQATMDLDGVTYKNKKGESVTFRKMLDLTYTDALLIMHKGRIIYEKYFNGQTPKSRHIMFSATKSLVGTVAAILAHQGVIDPTVKVAQYVSELKGSSFGDATVRQVMDMTTGIQYSETYADPKSEVVAHMVSAGYRPQPKGYTGPTYLYQFLSTLKKKGNHGHAFHYVSANTEVLSWIIERVSGKSPLQLFREEIWSKLGTDRDGYVLTDSVGFASWGGGFNGTARDMARFGQMMLANGMAGGRQLVPSVVVEDIRRGGDRKAFSRSSEGKPGEVMEGWSYRNQWWVTHNQHRAYTAIGIYGQWIYVDPKAEMVIVKQSSFTSARGKVIDDDVALAFHAMGKYLVSLYGK